MKKTAITLLGIFICSAIFAQTPTFSKGTNVVSLGIGLGSSIADYSFGSQTPAISAQYEKGLWEVGPGVISLGGYIGFKSYKYTYDASSDYNAKWNYTIIGVRGAYHYTGLKIDKLDVYGGVMISYYNLHYSNNYGSSGNYGSTAGASVFAGGRYYFTKNIGAYAEVGYGVSYLSLGLAFKFDSAKH